MKNSVNRSSSRSSGRSTAPTTHNQSSREEDFDSRVDGARPIQPLRRMSSVSKGVKVRPMPTSAPEQDTREGGLVKSGSRLQSNQRTDVESEPEVSDRTHGWECQESYSIASTQGRDPFKKKKRLSAGRSAVQTTLRITKKTAAHLVRVASRGRSSERRSERISDETDTSNGHRSHKKSERGHRSDREISSAEQLSCNTSGLSLSQRRARSSPPFAEYVTKALEKLQADPPRRVLSTIPPESAWKHLLLVPSSPFWVVWNLLHLLALGYICTVVPYMTALPSLALGKPGDWSEVVNRAIDIFYILDVVVNFRACYIDSETGEVVTDPRSVARHYMSSSVAWFVFDIVMAFPFDLLLGEDAVGSTMTFTFVRILRLVRLAKLLRILKLRPIIDFCEDNLGVSRNKLIVVQLVATIAFVAHLTACGFVLAATVGPSVVSTDTEVVQPNQRSWIEVNDLTDAPSSEVYVAALYWAFTMMTTVGFGDIVPKTLAERVYSILAMVISAGTYAYVIASMSTIVALMNLQQSRYYERINELNAYMASRQLPPGLQLRTRQFFRYYLTKKSVFDEHALFDVLPQNLREELVEHHVKTAMHHIHFFHELTERGFIGHIALYLRPVFFPPTSVIAKAQDHAAEMYFIGKGSCQVFSGASTRMASPEHSPSRKARLSPTKAIAQLVNPLRTAAEIDTEGERVVALLRDGDYFGEMALLCDAPRQRRFTSVRATTYCELHSLSYTHLTPALDKYVSVYKQMSVTAQARRTALEELQRTTIEFLLPGDHSSMNAS